MVWLIYTFDHLYDAIKINKPAILPRHQFHQNNFRIIGISWIVLGLFTGFFIVKTLYPITIYLGLLLAFLVMLHFILLNFVAKVSPYVQKELGIAFVYSTGIALPALSLSPFSFTLPILVILIQVFLLAYINLIEFSLFEVKEDTEEGQVSIVRTFGVSKTRSIIKGLLLINFLIAVINLFLNSSYSICVAEIILILMNFFLFYIYWRQEKFRINERYRIVGDAIFMLPGLLYFLI